MKIITLKRSNRYLLKNKYYHKLNFEERWPSGLRRTPGTRV